MLDIPSLIRPIEKIAKIIKFIQKKLTFLLNKKSLEVEMTQD
jgi:hypothetical protein